MTNMLGSGVSAELLLFVLLLGGPCIYRPSPRSFLIPRRQGIMSGMFLMVWLHRAIVFVSSRAVLYVAIEAGLGAMALVQELDLVRGVGGEYYVCVVLKKC